MRKQKISKMKREIIFSLIFIMLISIIPFVSSENDPGHDVLYIEQQGDSVLNGTINISQQLKVANRFYSSYLEILGNGSQPTGSFPQIYASDANTLAINSLTSLYLLKDAGSMVYVGGTGVNLNISGALYLGGNNRLYTAAGSASSLDLYWGDKLVCNTSLSNCGWATTATGGGDITSVQADNTYIYNGSDTGDVYLRFNESKLNTTIEARTALVGGDGNNYTTAIGFSTSGSTVTLNLNRSGSISNLTASFTDTGINITTVSAYGNNTWINLTTGATLLRTSTSFSNTSESDISVSGAYNTLNLQIGNSGITAGTYGNSTHVMKCNVSTEGRLTGCTNVSINFPAAATETDPIFTAAYSIINTSISTRVLNATLSNYMQNTTTYATISARTLNTSFDTSQQVQNNTIAGKALPGSSAACTYGIANFTTNSGVTPTVTCAAAQSSGAGNISARGATAGYITQFQNASLLNNSVIFQNGTNIGIGTTSPGEEVNLFRNVDEGVWIMVENYNTSTQALSGIALGSDVSDGGISAYSSGFTGPGGLFGHLAGRASFGSQTGTGINIMATDNTNGADIRFFTNGSFATNERMRIDGIGKVGIGDTTPDALLDVQSSSLVNQLRVSYDDSNYGNISVNSGGNMTIKATGHVIIDIS